MDFLVSLDYTLVFLHMQTCSGMETEGNADENKKDWLSYCKVDIAK